MNDKLTGSAKRWPHLSVTGTFLGLLVLHTVEILYFAGAYRMLLSWEAVGLLSARRRTMVCNAIGVAGTGIAVFSIKRAMLDGGVAVIHERECAVLRP
ncbi:hypothetical protein [Yoonia sp.]|uniref:hypothetical protein n=1 Tax=Yoonia sp. TaxID=2212373 RepID=UPI003918DD1F